jgi:TRAP-type uncharacterized transport system fused permease subunit
MSTGWLSMRLGSAKYIVPFFFALNPALIMVGPVWLVILAVITALIGCILLAASLEGWLYFYGKISPFQRIPVFIAGFLLMYPHWYGTIIGAAIIFLFMVVIKFFPKANSMLKDQPKTP